MGFLRRLLGGGGTGAQGGDGDGTAGSGRHLTGTAQVVSCSSYNGDGIFQACTLHLVVQVEGLAPYSTEHHRFCSRRKWPYPGMVLPVRVRAGDPHSVELDFDAVPDADDLARQQAEQQAAMLRGETPGGFGGFPGFGGLAGANIQFVGGSPADLPPEKRARLEQLLGVDLDGDGVVGTNPAPAGPPPAEPAAAAAPGGAPGAGTGEGADRIGQLERLARLHADGALTDEEFAAEKRRILGG